MAGMTARVTSTDGGLRHVMRNGFDGVEGTSARGHSRRMAAYQRAGVGLIYGDDGHWIADHLEGDERIRAQDRADAVWRETHRHCPQSARIQPSPPGCFVRYRCPECGQYTSLHPNGKVMPHAVRIDHPSMAQ